MVAECSSYCLVSVAPGNRIKGYITVLSEGKGKEKYCDVSEMNYLYPREDIGQTAGMLVKTLGEAADKMHHVNYLQIDMPSGSCYLEMFNNIGYACNKEYFDVVDGELINMTILRKNLSGRGLHLLAEAAAI